MAEPLVAVVVPVYEGGALLAGCLESVLAQTYARWVLVVADNASTDDSARIAESFAARDERVRVFRHSDHVGMLANWNRALSHVPDAARYVKQLNVDDRIRPDCLLRLVEAAESDPRVGVVSSYFTSGPGRYPRFDHRMLQIVPGRDAIREVLRGGRSHLVHPSVLLWRKAAATAWPDFYDATGFPPGHPATPFLAQSDKEAFFDILAKHDLAFVPEVLTDLAVADSGSATGFMGRVGAWQAGRIETILRHGERHLEPEERRLALRFAAIRYLRSLVGRIASVGPLFDPEFVRYQRFALAHLVPRLKPLRIGWPATGLQAMSLFFGAHRVGVAGVRS